MTTAAHLLQVTRLQKRYSAPVLVDFSFALKRGEVHALVGSQRRGQVHIRTHSLRADVSRWRRHPARGPSPPPSSRREAEHAGVIMVPQELSVIGTMSVAENMFLNRLPRRRGFVRFDDLHDAARRSLSRVGLGAVDPSSPAGRLGVGQQHLVAIAGALSQTLPAAHPG